MVEMGTPYLHALSGLVSRRQDKIPEDKISVVF